jgi:uncharacterized BrkB/YihY/UPF0761 family membrane protein
LTFGAGLAIVVWLLVSGAFAVYASKFGSYNKAWGSLSAVVVMLTWLWLSSLALLFGAEVNAEAERSRSFAWENRHRASFKRPARRDSRQRPATRTSVGPRDADASDLLGVGKRNPLEFLICGGARTRKNSDL